MGRSTLGQRRGEPPSPGYAPSPSSSPTTPSRPFLVRNLQRRFSVDTRSLKAFANLDERMRLLNRDFRGKDKPTDVLSFGWDDLTNGGDEAYLGDIVISVETARRQAERRRSTLDNELRVLTLHGFLHLLGYDHETDDGEMRRIEYRLRRRLGITRSRSPRGRKGQPSRRGEA